MVDLDVLVTPSPVPGTETDITADSPLDNIDSSPDILGDSDTLEAVPTVSPGVLLDDSLESESSELDVSDSSTVLYTYTEEQQQMDDAILGSINTLNGTCTLILFFLLFSWVDKKVQAIMNGVSGK